MSDDYLNYDVDGNFITLNPPKGYDSMSRAERRKLADEKRETLRQRFHDLIEKNIKDTEDDIDINAVIKDSINQMDKEVPKQDRQMLREVITGVINGFKKL